MDLKYISEDFFEKESSYVAKALLGATINNTIQDYTIIETEAYCHDDMDNHGKLICYGADKTKETATEVTAPLFDKPGTWCIYGGQLLISVTDDTNSDNVLIKKIRDSSGHIYGPDEMAKELHLYKTKSGYIDCHGKFSVSCDKLKLTALADKPDYESSKRVNISNNDKLNFRLKSEL